MKAELKEYDVDDQAVINQYDEMLDDLGLDNLNLPPASCVLKEVDPIAYNCGISDFIDGLPMEVCCKLQHGGFKWRVRPGFQMEIGVSSG